MFTNLNILQALDVLSADNAEALRDMIRSIPLPVKIISIYKDGNKHVAWILTEAKIKKLKKVVAK